MSCAERRIILYTKPGCHLCDDALELLLELGKEINSKLRIEEINILENPALYARYRYAIPVITVDPDSGGPSLHAPITRSVLRQALALDAVGPDQAFDSSEDKV